MVESGQARRIILGAFLTSNGLVAVFLQYRLDSAKWD